MDSISSQNQKLSRGEEKILFWLSLRPERGYFGPQKHIAEGIGYSRAHTNVMLQNLRRIGLVHIYRSRSIARDITFVSLDEMNNAKAIAGVTNG